MEDIGILYKNIVHVDDSELGKVSGKRNKTDGKVVVELKRSGSPS